MKTTRALVVGILGSGVLLAGGTAHAADFSGTWCVKSDPKECAVIAVEGDKVKGEFRNGGTKTVDLTGFQQGDRLAMSFRNSKSEVGAWMAVRKTGTEIDAVCLNPDGSERWKATYVKK